VRKGRAAVQDQERPLQSSYRQVGERLEAVRTMVGEGQSRRDYRWSGAKEWATGRTKEEVIARFDPSFTPLKGRVRSVVRVGTRVNGKREGGRERIGPPSPLFRMFLTTSCGFQKRGSEWRPLHFRKN